MVRLDLDEAFRRAVEYSVIENDFYENFRDEVFHDYNAPDRWDGFYTPSLIDGYSSVTGYTENRMGPSEFSLPLPVFLHRNQRAIRDEAKANEIDGRIVAGIIAGKCIEYSKGIANERARLFFPGQEVDLINPYRYSSSLDHSLLSGNRDVDTVPFVRSDTDSLIPLVARQAKSMIDVYFYNSGGIHVGDNPPLIALFVDWGVAETKRIANRRKLVMKQGPVRMGHHISRNPTSNWIRTNLDMFHAFQTDAVSPTIDFADFVCNELANTFTFKGSTPKVWSVSSNSRNDVPKGLYTVPAGSLIAGSFYPGPPARRVFGVPFMPKYSEPPFSYCDDNGFSWLLNLGRGDLCIHAMQRNPDSISKKMCIGIIGDTESLFRRLQKLNKTREITILIE